MADTHTYNYNDIQRYLQQQMSPDEMHAFEKAMMEDPFLADALEGFQNSDAGVAGRHLQEIEQEITGVKERSKVVPVMPVARNWWRIAALFIVITGMAIITYQLLNKTPAGSEIAAKIPLPENIRMDTLRPADKPLTQQEALPGRVAENTGKLNPPIIKETNEERIASSQKMKQSGNGSELAAGKSEIQQPALSAPTAADASLKETASMSRLAAQQQFEGKVVDAKGKPLRSASVIVNNNVVTTTDSNGNFIITSTDTTVQVNIASAGFEPATAKIKSKEPANRIVLNESNEAMQEVAATDLGKRTRKAALEQKTAPSATAPARAEPQNGWPLFYEYVNSALKTIKDTAKKYVAGDARLRFTVDSKGNPAEIQAVNAPNKEMEAKAIELLQKGPRWKAGTQNVKAEVVIRF